MEGNGNFVNGLPQARDIVTGHTDISSKSLAGGSIKQSGNWPVFDAANFRVITIVATCCFGDKGVAVAWADARSGHARVYYRLSTDGGDTWLGDPSGTPLIPNLVGDNHQFHPQLATTGSGVLGCAMYSYSKTARPGNKPGVSVLEAASFDEGVNWEFKPITDQPWDPAIEGVLLGSDFDITTILTSRMIYSKGSHYGAPAAAVCPRASLSRHCPGQPETKNFS